MSNRERTHRTHEDRAGAEHGHHPHPHGRDRRGHSRHHGGCFFSRIIHRVLDKSREVTGLPRGMVIAAYVLGFIFVPLLTALVALCVLYWSSYPDDARRNVDRVSRHARRAARKMGAGMSGPRPATEPDVDDLDFDEVVDTQSPRPRQRPREPDPGRGSASAGELRARFEKLERRARAIEAFVASEEYRLQREFDKMDDGPPDASDAPDGPAAGADRPGRR